MSESAVLLEQAYVRLPRPRPMFACVSVTIQTIHVGIFTDSISETDSDIVRYKCAPAAFMSSQFSSKLRGTTMMTDCAGDGSYRRVETELAPFGIYHSISTEGKKTRFTFECSFEAQITSTRRIRSYIRMNECNPSQ